MMGETELIGEIEPRVKDILVKFKLKPEHALYSMTRGKTTLLIMKHKYCELVAVKAGVIIDDLVEVETNSASGIAVIKCYAHNDKMKVITYGEASPKNCRVAYPYAMAEKRAVDRAILKLVGLHGFVYSEDEMEDTKDQKIGSADDEAIHTFLTNIKGSKTLKQATGYYEMAKVNIAKAKKSNPGLYQMAVAKYESKRKELQSV
tara:strand:- start:9505 stop:10116 length:612 start_codon:yes stop_codon:yes gene_type:complete